MADSFQQRISLEGAEDIIKNLQAIGAEATKALGQLKGAVTAANPALATLSTTSLAAQNALKGFSTAVSQATTLITPFSASLGGLVGVLGAFAGPAGILAAAGGLFLFARSTANSIIDIDRQANALGLSIQQFQALSRVTKAAGVDQQETFRSLQQFATQVAAQAQKQLGGVAEILTELVSGKIPGLTAGQSILRSIVNFDDINKIKAAVAEAIPNVRAFAEAANLPQAAIISNEQFAAAMVNVARRSDAAGAALRKLLGVATNFDVAITPQEKIQEQLKKSENSLESLRVSFLDGKAGALELFDALLKASDQLAKLKPGAARTALERSIGGRFGPEVLEAVKNARGEAGLLAKEMEKLGIPAEAVAEARRLIAAMNELESSGKKAQQGLLLTIGPTITSEIEKLTADIKKITNPQTILFSFKFRGEEKFNLTIDEIKRSLAQLEQFFSKDTGQVIEPPKIDFADSIVQQLQELPAKITELFGSIDWSSVFTGMVTAVNTAIDSIVQAFASLPGLIVGALSGLPGQIIGIFQGIVNAIVGLWDLVINKIRQAAAAAAAAAQGGAPGGIPMARGGYVWGPGSATSDSIIARLSRGEYVVQAAAVQHYGPALMAALNAMRLPRLPGFSLGGLADGLGRTLRANLAIPGMAAGGPTPAPAKANTVPITLDLRTDRGRFRGSAMADREVAEALSRFAVIDQITSMGKKSGAY